MARGRPQKIANGRTGKPTDRSGSSANLGFEAQLLVVADKLRKRLASKHVCGLGMDSNPA